MSLRLFRRLRSLLRRRDDEARMEDEFRFHLEMQTEANLAAGMAPEEARRAAERSFGRAERLKQTARDQRRFAWVDDLGQDARLSLRLLRRSPGFAAAAIVTLALGIGANTAIFSVVDGVLLRPLPYPESDRLVRVGEVFGDSRETVNYPNFLDWKSQQDVFDELGLWRRASHNLTGGGEPLWLDGVEMSADLFRALRIPPLLGRTFAADEDRPGAPAVAVLGHPLWQSRFGSDPGVVGRTITLDGRPYAVIGVMPAGFDFPGQPSQLWLPAGQFSGEWPTRGQRVGHRGLGRLRAGVTVTQARAALVAIAGRLERQYPGTNKGVSAGVEPLLESRVGSVKQALWVLLAAAGLVLLIACANVAGLLLARAVARHREMAVRAALGADRWRLVRQLVTESVVLAGAGAALGVLLAYLGLDGLVAVARQSGLPRATDVTLDQRVLVFSTALALLTGLLFGLVPAWVGTRVDVQAAFRDAAGGPGAGKARLRQGLVVAQIALTLVLLTGAGLLLQSFHHLRLVDAGFAHERLLSFRLGLPSRRYPTDESSVAFSTALVARLRTLPGVNDASVATEIPLDGKSWEMSILVEGQPEPPPHLRPIAELSAVEPHYFSVLGIPLRRGRPFTPDDDRRALAGGQNTIPNVVIVDELSARRHWPDADPIGQHLRLPWGPRLTVVGVAGHVKRERLRAEPAPKWQIYVPFGQLPAREISVVVKTALPAEGLAAAARAQVAALDPEQPIYAVHTLAELRDREMAPDRLNLLLVGVFALLALALAVIGLYGVLAYSVVQRRRELAVRLALGARREQVIALVVRQGIRLAVAGLAIGALAAVALTRTLGALLYHVSPTDPLVFAAAITTVSLVALLASYLPARRASQLDPIAILRHE